MKLSVAECHANPSIGLVRKDVREQNYLSDEEANKAYQMALDYWTPRGEITSGIGPFNREFICKIAPDSWVEVKKL